MEVRFNAIGIIIIWHSKKYGCYHNQTSQKPCQTIENLSIFSNIFM
jgi:hypothetical protein